MAYPAEGPIPVIDLLPNATVVIEAVDPTTGATVAGVSFSRGVMYAQSVKVVLDDEGHTLAVWLQPPRGTGGD